MIYHLLKKQDWQKAKEDDAYWPATVDEEGFIHCYTKEQLEIVGNELYPYDEEITLLKVDSNELESIVVFEDLTESGEMYPHIYGHINLDAVKLVKELKRNSAGKFVFFEEEQEEAI